MNLHARLDGLSMTRFRDRFGQEVDGHILERLKASKGHYAKAYTLEEEIRQASKAGMIFIANHDRENIKQCQKKMLASLDELNRLDIPKDILWKHFAQAAQEMVEFLAVCEIYSEVFAPSEAPLGELLSADDLFVTSQAWLAGVGDAVTEVGKMLTDFLPNVRSDINKQIELRERYVNAARDVASFLEQFAGLSPNAVNNNRYRGYFNSFRGMVGRIKRVIESEQRELNTQYAFMAIMKQTQSEKGVPISI